MFWKKKLKISPEQYDGTKFTTTHNGVNIFVRRTEHRQFYDSMWLVTLTKENETNSQTSLSCFITRDDMQDAKELVQEIVNNACITIENVKKLDEKSKIYYD